MFQRNDAPVHKVRYMKTWFVKVGVKEIKWPVQSPVTLTSTNTFGMNRNPNFTPGLNEQILTDMLQNLMESPTNIINILPKAHKNDFTQHE